MKRAHKYIFMHLLILLSYANFVEANEVYDVRLSGGVEKTRLVIELTEQVAFQVYNIPDPDRVIIDFDSVNFNLPLNIGMRSYGLVKEFRYGNFSLKKSRIVVDTLEETEVSAAFTVPKKSQKGALLVIDLVRKSAKREPAALTQSQVNRDSKQNLNMGVATPVEPAANGQPMLELDFQPEIPSLDELMRIVAAEEDPDSDINIQAQNTSNIVQSKIDLASLNLGLNNLTDAITDIIELSTAVPKPIKHPANRDALVLAARQADTNQGGLAQKQTQRKAIIVLDAGHGGIDSGTNSRAGTREKHIVLSVVKRLQKLLIATGKFEVYLTRKGDYFIKLRDRVTLSRKYKADLFISIHADSVASGSSSARGASIYTLSDKSSDKEAAALARKENRSDILAGVQFKNESKVVASILIDLAQRDSKTKSVEFANLAVGQMKGQVLMHKKPIKFAGFRVLKAPDVPSVLIELGYLSNRKDEQNLKSAAWQNKMAGSLQRSILVYFDNRTLF
ncbi:MAG: N-acetylmuramoyl-L-alanine amidase [Rhizobiales bacterium]|nr:N-acetylmuramoyl-L-alanine amidase [Hyphomicrobiales bacterium]NRB12955.1 N-acetylmuramoyl-L-alanine amidase [Hyphomicrobiales bacterium]